jgi:anhydro-N-acetylmuramic acid kinase
MLTERLKPARVESAHAVGWSIDSLEAQAFAYLAVRQPARPADHVSGHNGSAASADRGCTGAAVKGVWLLSSPR